MDDSFGFAGSTHVRWEEVRKNVDARSGAESTSISFGSFLGRFSAGVVFRGGGLLLRLEEESCVTSLARIDGVGIIENAFGMIGGIKRWDSEGVEEHV